MMASSCGVSVVCGLVILSTKYLVASYIRGCQTKKRRPVKGRPTTYDLRPVKRGELSNRHQIELLVVQLHVGADCDLAAERLLQVAEHRALLVAQRAGDVGVDAQHQALAVEVGADLLHLGQN